MDAIDRQIADLDQLLAAYHRGRLKRGLLRMETLDAIRIAAMCRYGTAGGLSDDMIRAATTKLAEAKLYGSHEDAAEEMLRRGLHPKAKPES